MIYAARPKWNYRLDLEYDGTDFSGWQWQDGERTVQGCVEDAVARLYSAGIRVSAAGRTDAGVHATGQVAGFRTDVEREPATAVRALNSHLPPDMRILSVSKAESDWHPRFSAKWRSYEYCISKSPRSIGRAYSWYLPRVLNVERMNEAAGYLRGSHSFRAFAHESPAEKHYLSDVYRIDWEEDDNNYVFRIAANRFLHGMVRLLVGTFANVGRGKIGPESVTEILNSHDVRNSGMKVPAAGLVLTGVGYAPWVPTIHTRS
ncbi:tRNA pseudouridine(38-40) synthase TruA [candidate division KSB1 bacterium]|nr:tRNA pseudouridine(38-40) synthase TruA [candidate division KSB1 bacterium]